MRFNSTNELPMAVRDRLPDVSLQQVYMDNFNGRAHEADNDKEDDSEELIRQSHAAAWLAVIEHLQHAWRDPSAGESLGPHPVLQAQESREWVAHFGDGESPVVQRSAEEEAAAALVAHANQGPAAAAAAQSSPKAPYQAFETGREGSAMAGGGSASSAPTTTNRASGGGRATGPSAIAAAPPDARR